MGSLSDLCTFCTFSCLPSQLRYVCHPSLSLLVTFSVSRRPPFPIMASWRHDDPIHFERGREGSNCRVMSHPSCCCFWGFQEILCDINMIRQGMGGPTFQALTPLLKFPWIHFTLLTNMSLGNLLYL